MSPITASSLLALFCLVNVAGLAYHIYLYFAANPGQLRQLAFIVNVYLVTLLLQGMLMFLQSGFLWFFSTHVRNYCLLILGRYSRYHPADLLLCALSAGAVCGVNAVFYWAGHSEAVERLSVEGSLLLYALYWLVMVEQASFVILVVCGCWFLLSLYFCSRIGLDKETVSRLERIVDCSETVIAYLDWM
jgi:hypothetical protein